MNRTPSRRAGLAVLAAVLAGLALPPRARSAAPWEKLKLAEHIESLKFGGDLRVRNDHIDRRSAGSGDRNRMRYRLRFGAEARFDHDLMAAFKLASGSGEQTSTNQSYDNLSGQKPLWIDLAYLGWSRELPAGSAYARTGRLPVPFWRAHSSQLVWDDDFNPEGAAEGGEWLLPAAGLKLFGHALQMVADEDSNSARSQWLFSEQLGLEKTLPWESRFVLAAAYHKWTDEQRSSFSQPVALNGNRRSGGVLVNRFGVGELTGQLSTWAGKTPVTAFATGIRNFRARGDLHLVPAACPQPGDCPAARDGYEYGLTWGRAARAGDWEATWAFRRVETDATVADISDSDFGDGGVNRQGHSFFLAYRPLDWLRLRAKYYTTKVIDRQFQPSASDVNRLFLDLEVKF